VTLIVGYNALLPQLIQAFIQYNIIQCKAVVDVDSNFISALFNFCIMDYLHICIIVYVWCVG